MRVGIVGCGHVAGKHLRALGKVRGVEVVSVCDADTNRGRDVATRFGVAGIHARLSEMIAKDRPAAVHILTPPATHRDLAVEALDSGCHVLVEKPMATRLDDADAMIEAARRSRRVLAVCHNVLYQTSVRRALDLLASGDLGGLVSVEIFWRIERPEPSEQPLWVRDLPGGIFQEVAPHPLYVALAFLGPSRVAAVVAKRSGDGPRPDELRVVLEGNRAHGSVTVSSRTEPYRLNLQLHGTQATLLIDLATDTLVRLESRGKDRAAKLAVSLDHAFRLGFGTIAGTLRVLSGTKAFGHENLVAKFYATLETGEPPPVSAEEGRALVALLDRVWEALSNAETAGAR